VPRIAVTGHRGLSVQTELLLTARLRRLLGSCGGEDLVGYSCVAEGADYLFARVVLELGGRLVVVVPAQHYRASLPATHRPRYDELTGRASGIVELPHREVVDQAYVDAGDELIRQAELLVAVWDGQPSRGPGGTADVVAAARRAGLPVTVVWPRGARRI
jgi:hypothetical protein